MDGSPQCISDICFAGQRVVQKTDKHLFTADSKLKDRHQINETRIVQLEALGMYNMAALALCDVDGTPGEVGLFTDSRAWASKGPDLIPG